MPKKDVVPGSVLRERAAARLAAQADPKAEAERHEGVLLKGIGSVQESFDWIVDNGAWTDLGFESVVEWWETRIRPVMVQMELRPSADMANKLLAKVREQERALPPAQRRTQKELAEVALVSDWKARGRKESRNRRTAAGSDLDTPPQAPSAEPATDPLDEFPAVQDAVAATIAEQAKNSPAGPQPSDTGEEADADVRTGADGGRSESSTPEPTGPLPGDAADEAEDEPAGDETGDDEPSLPSSGGSSDPVDEEQALVGVPAPAPPHFGDPAALLDWFAEQYEQVDVDVSGPLLTEDDWHLIDESLGRIAHVVELLAKWSERARP